MKTKFNIGDKVWISFSESWVDDIGNFQIKLSIREAAITKIELIIVDDEVSYDEVFYIVRMDVCHYIRPENEIFTSAEEAKETIIANIFKSYSTSVLVRTEHNDS